MTTYNEKSRSSEARLSVVGHEPPYHARATRSISQAIAETYRHQRTQRFEDEKKDAENVANEKKDAENVANEKKDAENAANEKKDAENVANAD
eukprot:scaffold609_cov130-Cylindrotheca_fusiformis.AAC.5